MSTEVTDWRKLIPHAAADAFPMMDSESFEKLVSDISENGLREPIVLYEGHILDGRNRHAACVRLNREPGTVEWDGEGSLVKYVVSMNVHRRHLSSSQLAIIAEEMLPMLAAEAKERQRKAIQNRDEKGRATPVPKIVGEAVGSEKHDGEAAQEAAEMFGTNRQYVSDAAKIKEASPELAEKVRAGELTIPEAKRQLNPKPSKNDSDNLAKQDLIDRIQTKVEDEWKECRDVLSRSDFVDSWFKGASHAKGMK